MATARQIIAMLSSHNEGNEEQFLSIALQVAAAEARRGRKDVADELRKLVDQARVRPALATTSPIPISRPRGELQNLLDASYPKVCLANVVLPQSIVDWLTKMLVQQRKRERLRSFNQVPITRVLLVGPPGSGKTLTASALAGELHLPLFTIRLEGVITRYMGETAAKLRLIFEQMANIRGVYLFDEFDAIGGRRNADNDVGEMRRVLNSFLQLLEEPNSTDSLVVAATNHPELLDRALFRRFDGILEFALPDDHAIRQVLSNRLGSFAPSKMTWGSILDGARGLSQAELTRACDEVVKSAILDDRPRISAAALVTALRERRTMRETISGIIDG